MNNTGNLTQELTKISRLMEKESYDKALEKVEGLLKTWTGNSHLEVLKAKLIMLQETTEYELDDAKSALSHAIELAPKSPAPQIELAYYIKNIEDNAKEASAVFAKGIELARSILLDGLIGQAKVYQELEKPEEFKRALFEILLLMMLDSLPTKADHNISLDVTSDGAINLNKLFWDSQGEGFLHSISRLPLQRFKKNPHFDEVQELLEQLTTETSTSAG